MGIYFFMCAICHKKNNFLLNQIEQAAFKTGAFLCETWRKNTLEKKNCIQLKFFKHCRIPKKTELKCLQLHALMFVNARIV